MKEKEKGNDMKSIDIIRQMVVVLLAGIGIVALLAIPAEGLEMSRWCLLMLVSKGVGIGAMALAMYILKQIMDNKA